MTVITSLTPSQFFDALLSAAKSSLGAAVIPPAIAFLQTVQKAPPLDTLQGQATVTAAAGQLQFALIGAMAGAAPAFVQAEQSSIAATVAIELSALLAKISTPATPATTAA